MKRMVMAGTALALVVAGWSLGKAQTTVADFEITVDAPRGNVILTCSRGCDWNDGGGSRNRVQKLAVECETERCRETFTGHGRVRIGMPR